MQIFIGILTEGTTDNRFIKSIIEKTFIDIAIRECVGQIDIETFILKKKIGSSFVEQVLDAAQTGMETYGISFLCVHADADGRTLDDTYSNKIKPASDALAYHASDKYCKTLVPIVPIQETESWMLADKELLKKEIGAIGISDQFLGIHRNPEEIADPKQAIVEAIRIARETLTKRKRKDLSISVLYLSIGSTLELQHLEGYHSYQDFKKNVRDAFRSINLLH